jgi:hypothetical protein
MGHRATSRPVVSQTDRRDIIPRYETWILYKDTPRNTGEKDGTQRNDDSGNSAKESAQLYKLKTKGGSDKTNVRTLACIFPVMSFNHLKINKGIVLLH